jgi:polyhydroxybutyrate depolymerase
MASRDAVVARKVRPLALGAGLVGLLVTGWLWGPACAHAGRKLDGPALERGALQSGGRQRTYALVDPAAPASARPRPLLIALHGRGGTGEGQARLTHLGVLAAREGFLLAYPDGIDKSWADARGFTPASQQGVDDVAFLSALIDHLVGTRGADPRRVYAAGMSNGGFLALRLACQLSGRVAAVVAVAANLSTKEVAACAPTRPIPVAFILGDQDQLVPYAGGMLTGGRGEVLSGAASAQWFASRNGCGPQPAEDALPDLAPGDGTRTTRARYTGCNAGAEVLLYTVQGGGHAWPGGWQYLPEVFVGKTSRGFDASEEAWRFVSRFALP